MSETPLTSVTSVKERDNPSTDTLHLQIILIIILILKVILFLD